MLPLGPPVACGNSPWVTLAFIDVLHAVGLGGGGGGPCPMVRFAGQSSSHHPTIVVSWILTASQNFQSEGAAAELRWVIAKSIPRMSSPPPPSRSAVIPWVNPEASTSQ